jgi:hypothetical protein
MVKSYQCAEKKSLSMSEIPMFGKLNKFRTSLAFADIANTATTTRPAPIIANFVAHDLISAMTMMPCNQTIMTRGSTNNMTNATNAGSRI